MRNKVEIRAFCVEQVIKMKFVDQCDAAKVVQESRVLEDYIVGNAEIAEYASEMKDMMTMFSDYKDTLMKLSEGRLSESYKNIFGCGLTQDEA